MGKSPPGAHDARPVAELCTGPPPTPQPITHTHTHTHSHPCTRLCVGTPTNTKPSLPLPSPLLMQTHPPKPTHPHLECDKGVCS